MPAVWKKVRRFLELMAPYHAIAGAYILLLILLKVVELFLVHLDASNSFQLFVNALVYNLVVISWTVLAVGVLYLLVRLLSRRAAAWLAAVLFAILLFSEVGLLFYSLHNGYLLGCELVARPLAESWMAVRGAVGIVMPVVLTVILLGGFIALALWRAGRPSKAASAVLPVIVLFALLSLLFKTSHLIDSRHNYFILNKTWYLAADSYNYFASRGDSAESADFIPEYDPSMSAELHATHPEWGTPVDSLYPLERPFVPDSFLDSYFSPLDSNSSNRRYPNIVVILVESLGHEMMGTGSMPFVDSLAATGLYWPNCLSATIRSYGALPALTGSVGGPKSFQFGTMPAHNSLLSLLKREGYNTRAYYGGEFTFDCIYEYLSAQQIDYLSPLFEKFQSSPDSKHGYWWGYNDDTLFNFALRNLNSQAPAPHLSVITTLSMHDVLKLPDARQQYYEQRAEKLPMPPAGWNLYGRYSVNLFTDDCLRNFIQGYSQRPDFQNTIFVIVGDHASGQQNGDKLSFHHVPLIIWSPLVSRPASFSHVVTHNDLAPALYSLLVSRYGLSPQPTVHWLGDGLGPSPKTLLVVNYTHEIHDIIFHNYYYQSANQFEPETLYSFGSDMLLHPCSDSTALANCRRQLELMRYLYTYTYCKDRLTAHPVYSHRFVVDRTIHVNKKIDCINHDTPPSVSKADEWSVLPSIRLTDTGEYNFARITIEADVTVHDSVYMNQFPYLVFHFDNGQYLHEADRLSKFLLGDATYNRGTYRLSLSKEFALNPSHSNILSITLASSWNDEDWVPNARFTLSNTHITIAYAR